MPTPVEQLWESFKKREFDGIQELIEANPQADLINSTHPSNGRDVPVDLIQITTGKKDAKIRALLNFVLTHPTLNWSFVNKGQTSVNRLIVAAWNDEDYSVIEGLNNTPGFIFNGEKLAYEVALKGLKEAESLQASRIRTNKPPEDIQKSLVSVGRYKKIVELIRDMSILFAIKEDNVDLFERLTKAGAQPFEPLGTFGKNKMPTLLFGRNQPNPKLRAWLNKVCEQENAERQVRSQELADRLERHGMFQAKVEQINKEHDEKSVSIQSKALEDRQDRIAGAIKHSR